MAPKPVFLFAFANDLAATLRLDEEWRQADRALQADEDAGRLKYAVIPYATREDVWDKFNRFHNQIAVFHYGGHSGGEGLRLTDSVLEGQNLATLLEQEQNLRLVFLNGCSNAGQVEALLEKGVPAVIATSAPISDRRAANLARQFYTALCSGRPVKQAFSTAAAYVNNQEEEQLVAYRGLVVEDGPKPFAWGLYAKDEAVLDWTIPQRGATGQKRGQLAAPAGLKRFLALSLAAVLLFLGYQFWTETGGATTEAALDCSGGRRTAVFVAPFQQAEVDKFSSNVITEIRAELADDSLYRVGAADFRALNTPDYYDTIQVNYFKQTCDTSGLFLGGLWDKQDSLLNCYINLYHLSMKLPSLSGANTIILSNPPGLAFSLRQDSEFLADFVIALLKAYEGEAFEALKKFIELERDSAKMQDPVLKAYVAHYKGNCYAMRGDLERAKSAYRAAARPAAPGLQAAAKANIGIAEQIVKIMRADPEWDAQRKENIIQDSLQEIAVLGEPGNGGGPIIPPNQQNKKDTTLTPEEPSAGLKSSDEGTPSEPERIQAIADKLKGPDGEMGQPSGGGPAQEDRPNRQKGEDTGPVSEKLPARPDVLDEAPSGETARMPEEAPADQGGANPPPEPKKNEASAPVVTHGTYKSSRDNRVYKTITINGQTWLAENLDIKIPRKSWYHKGLKPSQREKYGRLYTWEAAKEACAGLGAGWRLPTDEEWRNMAKLFGGVGDDASDEDRAAYVALIEGGSSGFAALLGGCRGPSGSFSLLGTYGHYWSGTEKDTQLAWRYYFYSFSGGLGRRADDKSNGFSCRCMKGAPSNGID